MNKVILIGNLTREVELRYTPQETAVGNFTLAVNDPYKKDEADFIPIVVWRKTAENCANYLGKGSQVAVEGKMKVRSYEDKEGNKRWVTEVVADSVHFITKQGS